MKIIKMDYYEYKKDLQASHVEGEKRGMSLIMTAVRDYITTGGTKTKITASEDDELYKFFQELKLALKKDSV
jgi:hypothetical protein